MTIAPDSPPTVFADVEEATAALRAEGVRMTTPRRRVLAALFDADGPVAAAHLARELSLEESSVYRTLELLEARGIVRHLHLGHSPGLYVRAREDEQEYLYCERCAKVTAVALQRLDPLRAQIAREFGHTPRFTHFAIVGVCEDCAGAPSGQAPAPMHSHGGYVHAHADLGRHAH